MVRESCHGAEEEVVQETTSVQGFMCYQVFVKTVCDGLGNKMCHIACNFLRLALTGFVRWRILPINFLFGWTLFSNFGAC
jgi:hypothetical protein